MQVAEQQAAAGERRWSLVRRLFSGRAPEQRSLTEPSEALRELFAGQVATAAGVRVSEESAQRLVAVYACVKIIAESVAQLPLKLYVRDGRGKREAREHPLYRVLHSVALPAESGQRGITALTCREYLQASATLRGTGYAQKLLDGAGRVRGLVPLRPQRMTAMRRGGRVVYEYRGDDYVTRTFDADDLFVLCGASGDGITGQSPIAANREAIGAAMAADSYAAKFFANGVHTSGVFEHPATLNETSYQRLKTDLAERGTSGGKTFAGLILEGGMKWQSISITPEDAQALETRKYGIADIARIFRVPLHKLAELDRATFSNIEQQGLDFITDSLMPWLIRWEQQVEMDLLSEAEREAGYFVKHSVTALLRGDADARSKFYASGRQWGWLSANDVRELEDLNPVDGGDTYLTPINMAPANAPTPAPADDARASRAAALQSAAAGAVRPALLDAVSRVVVREGKRVLAAAKRQAASPAGFDFRAAMGDGAEAAKATAASTLHPAVAALAASVDAVADERADGVTLDAIARHRAASLAGTIIDGSMAEVDAAVRAAAPEGPAAVAAALESLVAGWESARAATITDHEIPALVALVTRAPRGAA